MNQELISVISAFFGSLGFSIIYNIRGLRIWIPAIGGAVFWAVYLIFLHFINNEFLGFFFVAILITIYSEIWARILKTPSTVILMLHGGYGHDTCCKCHSKSDSGLGF